MTIVNIALLVAAVLFGATAAQAQFLQPAGEGAPGFERVRVGDEDYLFFKSTARWTLGSPPDIRVCWENGGGNWPEERELVREAIDSTWARYSALSFSGWGPCPEENWVGLRIRVAEDWPHTKGLGAELSGRRDGIVLNFDFGLDEFAVCRGSAFLRKLCIQAIAVHEFGHALGFSHEHNRDDRDRSCFEPAQGTDGDTKLTPYDPDSVMNYCNPAFANYGRLSYYDVVGLQAAYGAPRQ